MHYTTIEQSKHLLELGLKPKTADLFYTSYYDEILQERTDEELDFVCNWKNMWGDKLPNDFWDENHIPAWSLGALLKVMPKLNDYRPFIGKKECYYINDANEIYHREIGTPVEAAYSMVIWLLENDYIKKGKIVVKNEE